MPNWVDNVACICYPRFCPPLSGAAAAASPVAASTATAATSAPQDPTANGQSPPQPPVTPPSQLPPFPLPTSQPPSPRPRAHNPQAQLPPSDPQNQHQQNQPPWHGPGQGPGPATCQSELLRLVTASLTCVSARDPTANNDRLEYLGDAVLKLIAHVYVFLRERYVRG